MSVEKEEYLNWFKQRDFYNLEVDFGPNGFVPDAQILVDSHVKVLDANWGKPRYRAFAERLNIVKKKYEEMHKMRRS